MFNNYPVFDEAVTISMLIFERLCEMARITRHDHTEARAQFYGSNYSLNYATEINGVESNRRLNNNQILENYLSYCGDSENKLILDAHTHLKNSELNAEEVYVDDDYRRFTSVDIATHILRAKLLRDNNAKYLSAVIGCDSDRGSATLSIVGIDENNNIYHPSTVNVIDTNGVNVGALKSDAIGIMTLEDFGQTTKLSTVA